MQQSELVIESWLVNVSMQFLWVEFEDVGRLVSEKGDYYFL